MDCGEALGAAGSVGAVPDTLGPSGDAAGATRSFQAGADIAVAHSPVGCGASTGKQKKT